MPTIDIYRVKIDPADVDRLLEIRAAAVAEFQEQVPELVRADLVRLDDDVWLDILAWSAPVDPDRINAGDSQRLVARARNATEAPADQRRPHWWLERRASQHRVPSTSTLPASTAASTIVP